MIKQGVGLLEQIRMQQELESEMFKSCGVPKKFFGKQIPLCNTIMGNEKFIKEFEKRLPNGKK